MNFGELLAAYYLIRELYQRRFLILKWLATIVLLLRRAAGELVIVFDLLFATFPLRLR